MAKPMSANPPRNGEGDRPKGGGGGPRLLIVSIRHIKRARALRRRMSLPEVLLWQELRGRPRSLKFRRQFPIGGLTADFACLERRLIIEIDGESHSRGDQPGRDAACDAILRRKGFNVMRVTAGDVLGDLNAALCWILSRCSDLGPLHHSAAPSGPPPRSGED
ncbi:MAG: endonuclease domain-containing protein [Sphingomicrobium sp.]